MSIPLDGQLWEVDFSLGLRVLEIELGSSGLAFYPPSQLTDLIYVLFGGSAHSPEPVASLVLNGETEGDSSHCKALSDADLGVPCRPWNHSFLFQFPRPALTLFS